MSTRWGLIMEENGGPSTNRRWAVTVLEHVTGSREQALARLEVLVRATLPERPTRAAMTSLYRTDDGFLLITAGSWNDMPRRFRVAELLYSSEEAAAEERAVHEAERQRKRAEKAAKRRAKRGY
ncbi:hypothetical protein [Streptomyces sp. RFCAC02]|uniref:hypothetical protein n=1 Tax=Streptomyces sp. RFCAC02 TaxID=2499143 RepID=UPI00102118A4|nr:hypothetical protein [Streptomyces sp. RFCAC02]